MNTDLTPFKIGDTVWCASFESNRAVTVPCRVCFGKRNVALILGNDEIVVLPCDYCGHGSRPPSGEETVYEASARAQAVTVTSITAKETAEGTSYEYNWPIRSDNVFATEAEALARATELAAEATAEEERRCTSIQEHERKSYAWKAGYHLREAARKRRELAYHERMAVLSKEKAKPEQLARIMRAIPELMEAL